MAKWQGSFCVIKIIGRVNYLIEMPGHRKSQWIYHINSLKKWEMISEYRQRSLWGRFSRLESWHESSVHSTQSVVIPTGEGNTNDLWWVWWCSTEQTRTNQCKVAHHWYMFSTTYQTSSISYSSCTQWISGKELEEMEENGIIETSHSEWSSSILVVKKQDGNIQLCVDYRRLNAVTPVNAYPMPRIDEVIDKLGKAKFITTIDLAWGYWQVPMSEQAAFTIPMGLFQFRIMPGAPATCLEEFAAIYLDDIVTLGRNMFNM